jgi:hypothetical protein
MLWELCVLNHVGQAWLGLFMEIIKDFWIHIIILIKV